MVEELTLEDQAILAKFESGEWSVDGSMNPPMITEGREGEDQIHRRATHHEVMLLLRQRYADKTESGGDPAEQIVAYREFETLSTSDHGPKTFEEALDFVITRCRTIMVERQRKYGWKNIARLGQVGVMYQIDNKYWRLENLYFDDDHNPRPLSAETPDEGVVKDDTLVDLANYSMIELMLRMGIWGLPMEG